MWGHVGRHVNSFGVMSKEFPRAPHVSNNAARFFSSLKYCSNTCWHALARAGTMVPWCCYGVAMVLPGPHTTASPLTWFMPALVNTERTQRERERERERARAKERTNLVHACVGEQQRRVVVRDCP